MGNRSESEFLEGEGGFTMEFHFLNEFFCNLFPQGRKPSPDANLRKERELEFNFNSELFL